MEDKEILFAFNEKTKKYELLKTANTDITYCIKECENKFWHFHINEIDLTRIIYSEQHNTVAETLKNIKYSNYISIEMRTEENYRDAILKSLDCVDFMYKEQ